MFDVDMHTPLTDEKLHEAIDAAAKAVVDRHLEAPALLLIEVHKPLSFLASQSMLVAMPMLGPLIGAQRMADLSKILADRANVDLLITRIEEMSDERDHAGKNAAVEQE